METFKPQTPVTSRAIVLSILAWILKRHISFPSRGYVLSHHFFQPEVIVYRYKGAPGTVKAMDHLSRILAGASASTDPILQRIIA